MKLKKKTDANPLKPKFIPVVLDKSKPVIEVYTDGACPETNPGRGSWAFLMVEQDIVLVEKSGTSSKSTNNIMELTAIKNALIFLLDSKCTDQVVLYTDSQYALFGITKWSEGWIRKGWRDVKNVELWKEILALVKELPNVQYKWVKGHNGNIYNKRADELCQIAFDEEFLKKGITIKADEIPIVAQVSKALGENGLVKNKKPFISREEGAEIKKNKVSVQENAYNEWFEKGLSLDSIITNPEADEVLVNIYEHWKEQLTELENYLKEKQLI